MSVGVQSFPELYTTLMGWQLYDQLWSLLSQTGLAYLPFLGLIIKNMAEPYESQETKSASGTSLRRMEVGIIGMLLMIFFGVAPLMKLDASEVSFTSSCQSGKTYTPGDTGTTYDQAFSVPTGDIRVPLWWYGVLSVSAGITAAADATVNCIPNYRQMVTQVDMAQVTDPTLSQELRQFERDCYLPSKAQFLTDSKTDAPETTTVQNAVKQYGADDTEWLGSHGFQAAYYSKLQATQPIKGFTYDPAHDINAKANQDHPPAYGSPDCNAWWASPGNGLKSRLANALPTDFFTKYQDYFNDDKRQDDVIKRIINNNGTYSSVSGPSLPSDYGYSHIGADAGIILSELETYPTLYAISQAAPIVQALLLLMVFSFMPIVLVFSGYKPASFVTGAIIIFSLIFWSYIWHLVAWTDSTLTQALYGTNWFDNHTPNAILVTMIIGFMQIVAPLFWFGLMSAMGVAAGHLTTSVSNAITGLIDKPSAQAGSEVSETISKATKI